MSDLAIIDFDSLPAGVRRGVDFLLTELKTRPLIIHRDDPRQKNPAIVIAVTSRLVDVLPIDDGQHFLLALPGTVAA